MALLLILFRPSVLLQEAIFQTYTYTRLAEQLAFLPTNSPTHCLHTRCLITFNNVPTLTLHRMRLSYTLMRLLSWLLPLQLANHQVILLTVSVLSLPMVPLHLVYLPFSKSKNNK